MVKRIAALAFIVICTSIAWIYLSEVMDIRTHEKSYVMSDAIGGLWGTDHNQVAPSALIEWTEEKRVEITEKEKSRYIKRKLDEENHKETLELLGSDIKVELDLEHRMKGLLWFSTYTVDFSANYKIQNPRDRFVTVKLFFPFSSESAVYDNMMIGVPGKNDFKYRVERTKSGTSRMVAQFTMGPKASQQIMFSYRSRGLDQWSYYFGDQINMVKNFKLVMNTNFCKIDFPRDSISPDEKNLHQDSPGYELIWEKESIVSAFQIGMVMPDRLNPGPLAASMSSHAPVSLIFFFFLIFILQVKREIKMHPMNYFFLAASFFAFNLLFSYLVDHVGIKLAFMVSSAVSILLVMTYLSRAVGVKFALFEAGISQFIFLILFSFAHFYEGYTGLAITIGAILTLAVVMHLTAKIDWEEIFKDQEWGGWPKRGKKAAFNHKLATNDVPPPLP